MDYSLLLAITSEGEENREENKMGLRMKYEQSRNTYVGNSGYVYHLGIIDYLQKFEGLKILESRFKQIMHGEKKMEAVSAIDPEPYAARFLRFTKSKILKHD